MRHIGLLRAYLTPPRVPNNAKAKASTNTSTLASSTTTPAYNADSRANSSSSITTATARFNGDAAGSSSSGDGRSRHNKAEDGEVLPAAATRAENVSGGGSRLAADGRRSGSSSSTRAVRSHKTESSEWFAGKPSTVILRDRALVR